jgi:hypothetical protein
VAVVRLPTTDEGAIALVLWFASEPTATRPINRPVHSEEFPHTRRWTTPLRPGTRGQKPSVARGRISSSDLPRNAGSVQQFGRSVILPRAEIIPIFLR